MGSIGNQNALGNEGGRPPIYDASSPDDIAKAQKLCEEYFTHIKGEYEPNPKPEDSEEEWEQTYTCLRKPEPPTVTGLTLFLGFESKSTLYDYSKKPEFSHSIKTALTRIEQFHEVATSYGEKCVGNIFILKNFGWKDSQEIKHDIVNTPIFKDNPLND